MLADMQFEASGIYTTASPASGSFLKALNDGSSFVEITTLGVAVNVAFQRRSCLRNPGRG